MIQAIPDKSIRENGSLKQSQEPKNQSEKVLGLVGNKDSDTFGYKTSTKKHAVRAEFSICPSRVCDTILAT